MKTSKLIALLLIFFPLMISAADQGDQYPDFDNDLAAKLWGMWRHDPSQFTQREYGQVLELCNVAYDYLNAGYTEIIDRCSNVTERRRQASDMSDIGKSGNMVTFVRTFSNRMQNLASEGKLSEENLFKIRHMILKKREFKRLIDVIYS